MAYKILAINPGSTSTKVAVYEDEKLLFKSSIEHDIEDLKKYPEIIDQYDFRYKSVMNFLEEVEINKEELDAVVGRGGILPPVKSGAYKVNEEMIDILRNRPRIKHASNLGALIAYEIAKPLDINAYIYDSVAVDEFEDIARITGLKEVHRESVGHALNMRAAAIKTAKTLGKEYKDVNLIVAHLGGGISVSVHSNGRMIDLISDDEGAFSPERSGRIPGRDWIRLCYENDRKTMDKKLRGQGGMVSHFNSNDVRLVLKRIEEGDEESKLVLQAMTYQIAKSIGELATVVYGNVDGIVLTGGIVYSDLITKWIVERVEFISKVIVLPGENELESLSQGILRVLQGKELAREFKI